MRRTMVALAVGAVFLASSTVAAQTTRRCFDKLGNLFLTQGGTPAGAVCEILGNSKPAAKPIIKPPVAVQAPASTPVQAPTPPVVATPRKILAANDPASTRRNAARCANVALASVPRREGNSMTEQKQHERRVEDEYQKCMEAAGEKCTRRSDGVLDCGESR
jgi:hypothetical protein